MFLLLKIQNLPYINSHKLVKKYVTNLRLLFVVYLCKQTYNDT